MKIHIVTGSKTCCGYDIWPFDIKNFISENAFLYLMQSGLPTDIYFKQKDKFCKNCIARLN